jgi:hypothetical protein
MAVDPQNQNNFDMSERQLGFAYWFVTHKILLKKIALGVFIVFDAVFLLYGLYGFVDYFFITGPKETQMLAQLPKTLVDFRVVHQEAARGLEILSTNLVPSAGKYDLVAKIRNPNEDWYAKFNYNFIVDGKPTKIQEGFILPKEEKFLFELAVEGMGARTASLTMSDIRWQKINPHEIPDYSEWKRIHFNFPISDISFNGIVRADSKVFSQATFKVKNLTAFDFWHVDFKAVLYRGPVIAGVNFIQIDKFYTSDEKDVTLTWYEPIPGVTRVEVYPEVDVFDEKNYIK